MKTTSEILQEIQRIKNDHATGKLNDDQAFNLIAEQVTLGLMYQGLQQTGTGIETPITQALKG